MAWCGCSRKGRQSLASSGGGGAGWSVCTSTPYILWRRRSSKALRPFSGDVYGWVFCAKNWQLVQRLRDGFSHVALVVRLHVLSLMAAQAAPLYSTSRQGGDAWTMRRFSPRSSLGSPFTSTSYATSIRVASVCAT